MATKKKAAKTKKVTKAKKDVKKATTKKTTKAKLVEVKTPSPKIDQTRTADYCVLAVRAGVLSPSQRREIGDALRNVHIKLRVWGADWREVHSVVSDLSKDYPVDLFLFVASTDRRDDRLMILVGGNEIRVSIGLVPREDAGLVDYDTYRVQVIDSHIKLTGLVEITPSPAKTPAKSSTKKAKKTSPAKVYTKVATKKEILTSERFDIDGGKVKKYYYHMHQTLRKGDEIVFKVGDDVIARSVVKEAKDGLQLVDEELINQFGAWRAEKSKVWYVFSAMSNDSVFDWARPLGKDDVVEVQGIEIYVKAK